MTLVGIIIFCLKLIHFKFISNIFFEILIGVWVFAENAFKDCKFAIESVMSSPKFVFSSVVISQSVSYNDIRAVKLYIW